MTLATDQTEPRSRNIDDYKFGRALPDYFARQYCAFEGTPPIAALMEPRRIQEPPGYHSTKCVSAGLFTLLGKRVVKEAVGLPHVSTEISAHVIAYEVIRYGVPIYFVDEHCVCAVAATELPHDFTLED